MKLSHKQAGKRAWTAKRKRKADDLKRFRFRFKFVRTKFGIVKYQIHPLFHKA